MKKAIISALCSSVFFASCCTIPMRKCDDGGIGVSPMLRIINAVTGKDMLFGPDHVYDINAIEAYSLNGNDTTKYNCLPYAYSNMSDSVISIGISRLQTITLYLKLSNTDTDTLRILHGTHTRSCCEVHDVSCIYNGRNTEADNIGVVTIEK